MVKSRDLSFLAHAAFATLLGALLAAAQLLPVAELTRGSVRAGLTLAHANRFILPGYVSLYNFLLPNFFGNPATTVDYVARGNFWEPCCYAGVLAFALSVGAVVYLTRRVAEVRFWLVVAVVAVWLAMGRGEGLYTLAFWLLPGVAKFHDPARWLQIATFALACLAAHGLDAVGKSVSRPALRRGIVLTLLIVNSIDLFAFTRTLNPLGPSDLFATAPPIHTATRAYYADEGRLWGRFVSYRSDASERGAWAWKYVASEGPNVGTTEGFSFANGYEPVRTTATAERLARTDHAKGEVRDELWRWAGVTEVISLDARTTSPRVRPLPDAVGRASRGGKPLPVVDLTPDWVRVSHREDGESGVVRLADSAYPGWVADADGKPVVWSATDDGFRQFRISRQQSAVDFRYLPTSWRLGLFVSLCASGILMGIAGNAAAGRTRRIRLRRRAEDGFS